MRVKAVLSLILGVGTILCSGCAALGTDSGLLLDGKPLTKREAHEGMIECASILEKADISDLKVPETKTRLGDKLVGFLKRAADQEKLFSENHGFSAMELFSLPKVATKGGREKTRSWIKVVKASDKTGLENIRTLGMEVDEFLHGLRLPPYGKDMFDSGPRIAVNSFLSFVDRFSKHIDHLEKLNPEVKGGQVLFNTQREIDSVEKNEDLLLKELEKMADAVEKSTTVVESARAKLIMALEDYHPGRGSNS